MSKSVAGSEGLEMASKSQQFISINPCICFEILSTSKRRENVFIINSEELDRWKLTARNGKAVM